MRHEIIMPALGMAQDTGLLIAWHKQLGDAVASGDILLEVETDKSTMEVEAGHDGYVAELRAEAGQDVPVGQVIAIISAEKPDPAAIRPAAEPTAKTPDTKGAEAQTPAAVKEPHAKPAAVAPASRRPIPRPARAPKNGATSDPSERILASPKARRLADEQGIDLSALLRAGYQPPFHVGDLETLRALPVQTTASAIVAQHLSASIDQAGFHDLLAFIAAETGKPADRTGLLARFAAASLRTAEGDHPIRIAVQQGAGAKPTDFEDPDLAPPGGLEPAKGEPPATLLVRDLTETALTSVRLGAEAMPVLTLTRNNDRIHIGFEGVLAPEVAIALTDGFARRLAEPLRHLL